MGSEETRPLGDKNFDKESPKKAHMHIDVLHTYHFQYVMPL